MVCLNLVTQILFGPFSNTLFQLLYKFTNKEVYSELCQSSKTERVSKIVNC